MCITCILAFIFFFFVSSLLFFAPSGAIFIWCQVSSSRDSGSTDIGMAWHGMAYWEAGDRAQESSLEEWAKTKRLLLSENLLYIREGICNWILDTGTDKRIQVLDDTNRVGCATKWDVIRCWFLFETLICGKMLVLEDEPH